MMGFFKNLFGVPQKINVEAALQSISRGFSEIKTLLEQILRKEQLLSSNILVRSGFLIHHYELKHSQSDIETLRELKLALSALVQQEDALRKVLKTVLVDLRDIERVYYLTFRTTLRSDLLLPHLNNALANSQVAQVRIQQVIELLNKGANLNKQSLGKEAYIFLTSLEKMLNQIFKFILFLEQLSKKTVDFEIRAYYPYQRLYGRAGSSPEIKRITRTGTLVSSKELVPVFDAPSSTVEQIINMSRDQRKNFFAIIGVVETDSVVFFQTKLKPINAENPIPQTNGLREYKFPNNIPVQVIKVV